MNDVLKQQPSTALDGDGCYIRQNRAVNCYEILSSLP